MEKLIKFATKVIFFLTFYIFLPVCLTVCFAKKQLKILPLFYLANIFIAYFLFRKTSIKKNSLILQLQGLEEKINILTDQILQQTKNKTALKDKIRRYNSLKEIIEEINQNLILDSIAESLVTTAHSVIANEQGICILYLIDEQTQKLRLFKAKKEDKKLIIKAKEGDIFDLWVLRHTTPLFIEDTRRDFRFDLADLKLNESRPVASLISSPLITEDRFLGILRLDNQRANFYSQDDLRLLATLSDLGAVALENAELFEKTQDLAIHDSLTGAYTKGYFLERLNEECKRNLRKGTLFSLLMLDIDYFKNYNDKFGHIAGDIVLKNLSSLLAESLKDLNPLNSRFGGEEFCILLPNLDKEKASAIAQGLREKIEKTEITLRRQKTNITVSIGVATFPKDSASGDELIFKADQAMYKAKQKGRNQVISA